MAICRCQIRCVLLTAALLVVTVPCIAATHAQPDEDGEVTHADLAVLSADDECAAGPDPAAEEGQPRCAMSALQLRAGGLKSSYTPPCDAECQRLYTDLHRWCLSEAPPAKMWKPLASNSSMDLNVLSYNLYWWMLFGRQHGKNNAAGNLIKRSMESAPFDFMGFQECEDPDQVLGPAGLLDDYEAFQGEHAICMAYRKTTWSLISHATDDVAEDMPNQHYGKRSVQWMRLKHLQNGYTVFFMNHHGPLSVNSGGACGGESTADNILHVAHKHGEEGDLVILVGDFNANAAGATIQRLWPHLTHVYAGPTWAGVDNIFSNVPPSGIVGTHALGHGGSDHEAISAVISVPSAEGEETQGTASDAAESAVAMLTAPGAEGQLSGNGNTWEKFWCGLIEFDIKYEFDRGGWQGRMHERDPQKCCHECQKSSNCQAWVITDGFCLMKGGTPTKKTSEAGAISGLSVRAAAAAAKSFYGSVRSNQ